MSEKFETGVMQAVPPEHPLMQAWNEWKASGDYANSKNWAAHKEHVEGSMWNAFMRGWQARTALQSNPDNIQEGGK